MARVQNICTWSRSRVDLEAALHDYKKIIIVGYRHVKQQRLTMVLGKIQPTSRCYQCNTKGTIKALKKHARETRDDYPLTLIPYVKGQVFLILTNSQTSDVISDLGEDEIVAVQKAGNNPKAIAVYEEGRVTDLRVTSRLFPFAAPAA